MLKLTAVTTTIATNDDKMSTTTKAITKNLG